MKINLSDRFASVKKNDRFTFLAIRFAAFYSIFLFIILIMTVYLHHVSSKRSTEEFWFQNEATFKSAVSLIDSNFATMDSICRQLTLNTNFYHLARMDVSEKNEFYLAGLAIKRALSSYMYSYTDLPINSCYLYLRNNAHVIGVNTFNSEHLYYLRNYDATGKNIEAWHELIFAENGTGTMYSLDGFVPAGNDNAYLYLIDVNVLTYKDVAVTAGFHISTQKLHDIFRGVSLDDNGCVVALSGTGEPVLFVEGSDGFFSETSTKADILSELSAMLPTLSYEGNHSNMNFYQNDMHVTRVESDMQDWSFYLIQPESLCPVSFQWLFYLALFIAVSVGLSFVFWLVRASMQPIIELDGELQETIVDRNQLKQEVEAVRPIIYSNYLRQLMSGNVTAPDELVFIQNYLHLENPALRYYVMYGTIYEYDFLEGQDAPSNHLDDINEQIVQILAEFFSYHNMLYMFSPKKRIYAILLPFEGDSEKELFALQEKVLKLHSRLLDEHQIWFFTGIGLPSAFSNIWESYQQAKDAAGYTTKNYIFLPYEMLKKDSHVYYYPMEVSSKLIRFITSGNKAQVMEIFNLIHQENIEERSLPVMLLRFLLSDIRNTLLKARFTYTGSGADASALLTDIDASLSQEDITFQLCEDIGLKLCELFGTRCEKNDLIDSIVTFIHAHYNDPSLCLGRISDEFHISESYFSHMFKENRNINFSVYLEDLRLTEAVRLIQEGKLTISEIAEKVGYNNLTSFRRAFKKKYGVTPSNYE